MLPCYKPSRAIHTSMLSVQIINANAANHRLNAGYPSLPAMDI